MRTRLELSETLHRLMDSLGERYGGHIYYQPPTNTQIKYPCLMYEKAREDVRHANNSRYIAWQAYTITAIDWDPDGPMPAEILKLPYCSFDRRFINDNLYHDVFTIYI